MDLLIGNDFVRSLRHHYAVVRWLHRLPLCSPYRQRVGGLPSVGFLNWDGGRTLIYLCSLIQTNATFRDIVISLAATYGLYLIGSIIHGEPWHMFTSFLQYLFLQPSCKFFSISVVIHALTIDLV